MAKLEVRKMIVSHDLSACAVKDNELIRDHEYGGKQKLLTSVM